MLNVMIWDEINMEWSSIDLDIPNDTRDPNTINEALGKAVISTDQLYVDDERDMSESCDGWRVASWSMAGPIMTIETRSDRNHLAIIIINYENQ